MNTILSLLDTTHDLLRRGSVADGMTRLACGLNHLRVQYPEDEWRQQVRENFDRHALRQLIHQSPFSRRAFEKPRGYAGDAVMLGYIYRLEPLPEPVSPLGRSLFEWEILTDSCRAVRDRRELLAAYLDAAAQRKARPDILSVACGHLREAALSRGFTSHQLGRFVAFDQDQQSLETVASAYVGHDIETICGSVRGLVGGDVSLGAFDLIYAAGLYDYLAAPVASLLTAKLFQMLSAAGTLLIVNFTPDLPDIGCMETSMDWRLIYREEAEMAELTKTVPQTQITRQHCFRFSNDHLIGLDLQKAP